MVWQRGSPVPRSGGRGDLRGLGFPGDPRWLWAILLPPILVRLLPIYTQRRERSIWWVQLSSRLVTPGLLASVREKPSLCEAVSKNSSL